MAAGPPSSLVLYNVSSFSSIQSGEVFPVSPRVAAFDFGGNLLTYDSRSVVRARIYGAPPEVTLGPPEALAVQLVAGVATFSGLRINSPGSMLSIFFDLYSYAVLPHNFTYTNVSVQSPYFTVVSGPPRLLGTNVSAGKAWAGGQPFLIQPSIAVEDFGGYPRNQDFSTVVSCFLVPSLAIGRYVVIDTFNITATNNLTFISLNLSNGTYGAGQIVLFYVNFDYPVTVEGSPYLLTTITDSQGNQTYAVFDGPTSIGRVIVFKYVTKVGDKASDLNFDGPQALVLNGSLILDYYGNTINTTLPSPVPSGVVIDTSPPLIIDARVDVSDGEYGAGQRINFFFTYNVPVVVDRVPTLNLSGLILSTCVYNSSLNNSFTLQFQLVIAPGENSTHLSLYDSAIALPGNASIKCLSSIPTVLANNSLVHVAGSFATNHNVTVDTSAPFLDVSFGITSSNSVGTYLAGDSIRLCVRFTKQIVVHGTSVTLALDCGISAHSCFALLSEVLPDSETMCFTLKVPQYANTTSIRLIKNNALFVGNEDYIRRNSTFPTTAANLSTSSLNNIQLNYSLNGFPSQVVSISVVPPFANVIRPDDSVIILVEFTLNVTASCDPAFQLSLDRTRQAFYLSGNRSRSLYFEYVVRMGDSSNGLFYPPNALCTDTTCLQSSPCTLLTLSADPMLAVDLRLPSPPYALRTLLANITVAPTSLTRNTSIVNITCEHSPGNFSAGEDVVFNVYFSDAILLNSTKPLLHMNTGGYATLIHTINSSILSFVYSIQESDANIELQPSSIMGTTSSILCVYSEFCTIRNALGDYVNLTTSHHDIQSEVFVDTSSPVIVAIFTLNDTSIIYTAGDTMSVCVKFNRPVAIRGTAPWLALSLNRGDGVFRYAEYKRSSSDDSTLIFDLAVQIGDYSANLSCNGTYALNFENPTSHIFALSSHLTTLANLTLPYTNISADPPLVIDAVSAPQVISVICLNSSGRFAPGDTLIFEVAFSLNVSVNGNSFLNLNVGPRLAQASYVSAALPALSNRLFYAYTVVANESSYALDYADEYSYFPGFTSTYGVAFIRRSSQNPLIAANLKLPSPGAVGSISYASFIIIDGFAPYVTSLNIQNADGIYGLKNSISIAIEFSAPVSVMGGTPSINLNIPSRFATYVRGSGTATLIFEYLPQPGDIVSALDYYSDSYQLFSTSGTFSFGGAQILATSANPELAAEVHFNPPLGVLTGTSSVAVQAGVAYFADLGITRPGPFFRLNFVVNGTMLRAYQDVNVSFSSEFELRPDAGRVPDQIGSSVAIDGTTVVVGAPNTALPDSVTTEVQTITTSAIYSPVSLLDIQLVETRVTPQPSIQQFYTTGAVGSTLGGYYRILMGYFGPSRPIPYNADPLQISAFLAFDMPELGNVTATKEKYNFCACEGAYQWTLTFNDLNTGLVEPITLDGSLLTGTDAQIIGPNVLQEAAVLQGTFTLSMLGTSSMPVAYDAGVDEMTAAVTSLGFGVDSIAITSSDPAGARGWFITFSYHSSYIPELKANASGLFGAKEIEVWTDKLQNATYGSISGDFILTWRGNSTAPLPFNVSASEMEAALDALPVIGSVTVFRCCETAAGGFTWTITFNQVKSYTIAGYVIDPSGPLDLITAENRLVGNEATIKVTEARQGTTGAGAGVAYVYQLIGDVWQPGFTIRGNDTSQSDNFGCSVSISDDLILIGAKGASKKNKASVQAITCIADSGLFTISFRGWVSSPIPWNVTVEELQAVFLSNANANVKSPGLGAVIVGNWGPTGLCENNTAVLTFSQPIFGSLVTGSSNLNLELLTLSLGTLRMSNSSENVTLHIQSIQDQITRSPSDPLEQGSAYLFRRRIICPSITNATCVEPTWVQEAEFYPPAVGAGFERFGAAVAVSSEILAIGCPGLNQETGAVFVYRKNYDGVGWIFSQMLSVAYLNTGDQFGLSLTMNNGTLIVGAPFRNDGNGEIFCFRLYGNTNVFVFFQDISLPNIFAKVNDDYFGWSVAISGDVFITGAIGRDEAAIYLGTSTNAPSLNSGAVYVFRRGAYEAEFLYEQMLVPSNVHSFDRFGFSVAIDGDLIVASALEDYSGVYLPSKAIYSVTTTGAPYRNISGYFTLVWEGSTTRPLQCDISAYNLQNAIQFDLNTGTVLVSRLPQNTVTSGYTWLITFVGQSDNVSTLSATWGSLLGHNATVIVTLTSPSPEEIRAVTHVFKLEENDASLFVEELFLTPYAHQPIDLCGYSVALSMPYAVVGCPNRDVTLVPNNNTGAAFAFNLSILDFQFSSYSYEVIEGDSLVITSVRRSTSPSTASALFYMQTIDRVATEDFQTFIKNIYGIGHQYVTYPSTYADASGAVGTARGRSRLSNWLEGYYDFKALSDFQIESIAVAFLPSISNKSINVLTNDDKILELPNENFTTVLNTPGVWPSLLGKLISVSTILDNHNGYITNTSTTVYDKLYDVSYDSTYGLGSVVDILDVPGILVAGAPLVSSSPLDEAGVVFVYIKVFGIWVETTRLVSPRPHAQGRFGDSVALSFEGKFNITLLAVGEPGMNSAYVFSSADGGYSWFLEQVFSRTEVDLPQYELGKRGTIAWGVNLLAIGVPLLETTYVYHRFVVDGSVVQWDGGLVLKSSDYSYDVIFGQVILHNQYFGASVAISRRTMVVGSPFANYYDSGNGLPGANVATAGINLMASSKGKVYLFYSQPSVQRITLHSTIPLRHGTFRLSIDYKGYNLTTDQIHFNTTASELGVILGSLVSLGSLSVYANTHEIIGDGFLYIWTITFNDEWQNVPLLTCTWYGNGCSNCTGFDGLFNSSNKSMISVEMISNFSDFVQYDSFSASDGRSGDRFGSSVAIDGDQLAVSAYYSAAVTTSTWDFENGTLEGWSITGTAFAFQPTFGDNSYFRAVYPSGPFEPPPGSGQSCGLKGRYFIGTFEMRPGSAENYLVPDLNFNPGSVQGDEPVGSLTSQVFMIQGNNITLLVGGGCDIRLEYVELIVDGFGVARVTGQCSEKMQRVFFDTSSYLQRAAQIRIVDASSDKWGHINVDDITFSWDVEGSLVGQDTAPYFGGKVETPLSGAVYVYHRYATAYETSPCLTDVTNCPWVYENRLTPSDKRSNILFGASLALSEETGILVVGAPLTADTGIYKELLNSYPSTNLSAQQFPLDPRLAYGTQSDFLHSGAASVWNSPVNPIYNATLLQSGSIYIFTKIPAKYGQESLIGVPQHWYNTETVKFQPSEAQAGDYVGYSLALDGLSLAVGAPGQDSTQPGSGAVYSVNLSGALVSFIVAEYIVSESQDATARVIVFRDTGVFVGDIYVDYATSDLSARGEDEAQFLLCMAMAPYDRGIAGCGDYRHTQGTLFIPRGYNTSGFLVPLINNDCLSRFPRYIQLNLYVTGSAVFAGQTASATIRIDDDDFSSPPCIPV